MGRLETDGAADVEGSIEGINDIVGELEGNNDVVGEIEGSLEGLSVAKQVLTHALGTFGPEN